MSGLFTDHSSHILALGVGRMGTRVATAGAANAGLSSGAPAAAWGAAHFDRAELLASGLERKLIVPVTAGPFSVQAAHQTLATLQPHLAELCSGRAVAILAGSFAEEETVAVMTALAAALRENGLFVCIMGCAPENESNPALEILRGEADLLVPLGSHVFASGLPDNAPLSAAQSAAERKLLAAVEALAGVLTQGLHDGSFTLHALRHTLRGGGPLALGLGLARGANAPLLAADAALSHVRASVESRHERLTMNDAHASGIAAAVVCGRELSVSEAEGLNEICRSGVPAPVDRPATLLGHCTQEHLDAEAICLLLVRFSGSKNVIALSRR